MGSILSYDPDGETVGNAPSGWTRGATASATVQNAPSGMSGQSIRIPQVATTGDTIKRSYTKQSSGTHYVSFQVRIGATTNRRYGDVMIYDGANRAVRLLFTSITVGSDNNAVRASNGGTYFTVVGLSTSTTYNVVVALDSTNKKWSVRINGTLYDNSGSLWSFDSGSAAAGDSILVDSYSPEGATSGEYTWFDKLDVWTNSLTSTVTADAIVETTEKTKTLTADAIVYAAPSLSSSCDKYGVVSVGVTGASSGSITKVERSADGSSWSDVTSAGYIATTGSSGSWTITDKRPQYGSGATTYGGTAYYRVTFSIGGATKTYTTSTTTNVDRAAVNLARASMMHSLISAQSGGYYAVDFNATVRDKYPGQWVVAMAYAYYLTGTSSYKTDATNQFDYIVNSVANADHLLIAPDATTYVYRDFHARNVYFCALAARLMRLCNEGTLAASWTTEIDKWGKAFLDKLTTSSITRHGWDANNANSTSIGRSASIGRGRRGYDATTGYQFECITAGTTASSAPSFNVAVGSTVTDGTVTWRRYRSNTPWATGTAYTLGQIVKPTTNNSRTYRCITAGTSHASTEPTWPTTQGSTVTDGTVTWRCTTYAAPTTDSIYTNNGSTYPHADTYNVDLNQNTEEAAAWALLITDPNSAFYSAGAYRTSAETRIADITGLAQAYQVSSGAFAIGDPIQPDEGSYGRAMYDTVYGSFSASTLAITYRLVPSLCHVDTGLVLSRSLDWFDTSYGTEPLDTMQYGGGTSISQPEIDFRDAGYKLIGRSNPVEPTLYTAAFNNTSNDKWGYYGVNGTPASYPPDAWQSRSFLGPAVASGIITTASVTADATVVERKTATFTADARAIQVLSLLSSVIAAPTSTRSISTTKAVSTTVSATIGGNLQVTVGRGAALAKDPLSNPSDTTYPGVYPGQSTFIVVASVDRGLASAGGITPSVTGQEILSATVTGTSTLTRTISKTLAASTTASSTLKRSVSRTLSVTATGTASIDELEGEPVLRGEATATGRYVEAVVSTGTGGATTTDHSYPSSSTYPGIYPQAPQTVLVSVDRGGAYAEGRTPGISNSVDAAATATSTVTTTKTVSKTLSVTATGTPIATALKTYDVGGRGGALASGHVSFPSSTTYPGIYPSGEIVTAVVRVDRGGATSTATYRVVWPSGSTYPGDDVYPSKSLEHRGIVSAARGGGKAAEPYTLPSSTTYPGVYPRDFFYPYVPVPRGPTAYPSDATYPGDLYPASSQALAGGRPLVMLVEYLDSVFFSPVSSDVGFEAINVSSDTALEVIQVGSDMTLEALA